MLGDIVRWGSRRRAQGTWLKGVLPAWRLDLGLFETRCHSNIGRMQRVARRRTRKFPLIRPIFSCLAALSFAAQLALAEIPDWEAAVRPLDEGVPQVAVM